MKIFCCLFVILLFCFSVVLVAFYFCLSYKTFGPQFSLPPYLPVPSPTSPFPQIHSSCFSFRKKDYPGITTEHDMTRTVKLGTNNHIKTEMANDLEERLPREGRVNPTTTVRS